MLSVQELIREHNIQVSESTIYRYIYDDRERGGELYKNLPHSGKPYKKKVSRGDQTKYLIALVLNNGLLLLMKRQSLVILKLIRLWVVTTNLIY